MLRTVVVIYWMPVFLAGCAPFDWTANPARVLKSEPGYIQIYCDTDSCPDAEQLIQDHCGGPYGSTKELASLTLPKQYVIEATCK
jgi:hypothetical protein